MGKILDEMVDRLNINTEEYLEKKPNCIRDGFKTLIYFQEEEKNKFTMQVIVMREDLYATATEAILKQVVIQLQ